LKEKCGVSVADHAGRRDVRCRPEAALAVDRDRFAETVTPRLPDILSSGVRKKRRFPFDRTHPVIVRPDRDSASLSADIAAWWREHLYFTTHQSRSCWSDSIDRGRCFGLEVGRSLRGGDRFATDEKSAPAATPERGPASRRGFGAGAMEIRRRCQRQFPPSRLWRFGGKRRWGLGPSASEKAVSLRACWVDDGEGDYLNCPFTREEYALFTRRSSTPSRRPSTTSQGKNSSEGCLPIE